MINNNMPVKAGRGYELYRNDNGQKALELVKAETSPLPARKKQLTPNGKILRTKSFDCWRWSSVPQNGKGKFIVSDVAGNQAFQIAGKIKNGVITSLRDPGRFTLQSVQELLTKNENQNIKLENITVRYLKKLANFLQKVK